MLHFTDRLAMLQVLLSERILILDGAIGTAIQDSGLSADDFGGPELEGCNEHLVLTRPDVVQRIHHDYLLAGADLIETDSFGGDAHCTGRIRPRRSGPHD